MSKHVAVIFSGFIFYLLLASAVVAEHQIYVSDSTIDFLSRYSDDGSTREELLVGYSGGNYMDVDTTNDRLYWPAFTRILASDLDGSNFTVVYDFEDGLRTVFGVAVDPVNGHLYWADNGSNEIMRGNLDGSGTPVTIFDGSSGVSGPVGIRVDVAGGKVYWTENNNGLVRRGNLDGSGVVESLHNVGAPIDLFLDIVDGLVYWTDNINSSVYRGNMDGSGVPELLFNAGDGATGAAGIAVDTTADILYMVDASGFLRRGNQDGSGTLTQIYDLNDGENISAQGVAVVPASDQVFMVGDVDIFTGNRDGTTSLSMITDLRDAVLNPTDFALDLANNYLYIVDSTFFKVFSIVRTELDFGEIVDGNALLTGTIETVFNFTDDGIQDIGGLAIDSDAGKLYLADTGTQKIQRGNVDGSGALEDLFDNGTDGIDIPSDLKIDTENGLLYWIDANTQKVQRGNADGSGAPTDLFSAADGIGTLSGFAIDLENGHLYWGDSALDKIFRGNIDGSGTPLEIFNSIDGVSNVRGISLDIAAGKLIWAENSKVYRGNLDGSGAVEEVVGNLLSIEDLVVTPDGDSDGVPDEIDECPVDANKGLAGDCGCGVEDRDDNNNSISDCLYNKDTRDRITTLRALIKGLKWTGTSNEAKNAKRRRKQRKKIRRVRRIARQIFKTIKSNKDDFSLTRNAKLVRLAKRARNAAIAARDTDSRNFVSLKRNGVRRQRKLLKLLAE